jgi:hypothetical protein
VPDLFEPQLEIVAYMDSSLPQVGSVVVAQEPSPAVTGTLHFLSPFLPYPQHPVALRYTTTV